MRRCGRRVLPSRATAAQLSQRRAGAAVSDHREHEKGRAAACDPRVPPRERAALPPRGGTGRAVGHVTAGLWEGTRGGRGRSPRRSRDRDRDQDREQKQNRDRDRGDAAGMGRRLPWERASPSAAAGLLARNFPPPPQGGAVFSAASARLLCWRLSTHRLC